jgi:hypothetical protein
MFIARSRARPSGRAARAPHGAAYEDLDVLLDAHPKVERQHVKLWLTGGTQLDARGYRFLPESDNPRSGARPIPCSARYS